MTNPRKPFRLNVGFLIHEEVGAASDFPFEYEQIQVAEDLELADFQGLAHIGRTPQGLLVQANFRGRIALECVRCLTSFAHQLGWSMTEMYAFQEKSVSEAGLMVPEDAQLDLQPLVREYALLEIPINPVCRPDCKGLCPVCGQNLNDRDCGHRPPPDESPFSVLKDLH